MLDFIILKKGRKMKHTLLSILVISAVSTLGASDGTVNGKSYRSITIEKYVSATEIKAYKRDGKEMGIKVIDNPKFTCLKVGYTKVNLLEKGTLYGTKMKDGNTKVGQKGDFKVYSFVKYFKNGHFCVETSYEKGDARYGKGTVATLY